MAARRLTHIDALRGIATIWVVLFHEVKAGPLWEAIPTVPRALFEWGHLGVAIFFALSGFVIARSLGNQNLDRSSSGRFLVRRYVRLLPPYYFSIAVVLEWSRRLARPRAATPVEAPTPIL